MAWFRSSAKQQQTQSPQGATATAPVVPPAAAEHAADRSIAGAPSIAPPRGPVHPHPHGHGHGHAPGGTPHSMPVIGYPEAYYLKHVKDADERGDQLGHDAYKVGQYVTLGMDHKEPPERKAKYFGHALRRHSTAPPGAQFDVQDFYHRLADLVRKSAGQEILRLVKKQHETLQKRLAGGANRELLVHEFSEYMKKITADSHHHCPEWLSQECWDQIRAIKSHWA